MKIAKSIKPSAHGESEITIVNQEYLRKERLAVQLLGRDFVWFDADTHESHTEVSFFVETIEHRQGLRIACLEEISFTKELNAKVKLIEVAQPMVKNHF